MLYIRFKNLNVVEYRDQCGPEVHNLLYRCVYLGIREDFITFKTVDWWWFGKMWSTI